MIGAGGLRGQLLVFLLVVVVVGVVFGVRGHGGLQTVSEVPTTTLPAAGVNVGGQILLQPLTQTPPTALSKKAAIAKARRHATDKPFPATALEASVTVPGNSHVHSEPAWVVTFTSPKATNVSQTTTPVYVRHFSVVLDAVTGKFLAGFFTK